VDEQRWLAGENPREMLAYLGDRVSARQLRLIAAACCRCAWDLLTDARAQALAVTLEQRADGRAGDADLTAAGQAIEAACAETYFDLGDHYTQEKAVEYGVAHSLRHLAASGLPWDQAAAAAHGLIQARGTARSGADGALDELAQAAEAEEALAQGRLLQDILGNPFRPVACDPAWLTWRGGDVRRLAEAAYRERALPSGHLDPARLTVVADALEEAGCAVQAFLGHLRSPGPHVRGCFAIDVLTGRG
jgi:hypothetical protein